MGQGPEGVGEPMSLKRLLRNKSVLTVLPAGVALAVYACLRTASSHAAAERYRTEVVRPGEITQTVSANGTLNPVVLVRVGTQVSGTVSKLHAARAGAWGARGSDFVALTFPGYRYYRPA